MKQKFFIVLCILTLISLPAIYYYTHHIKKVDSIRIAVVGPMTGKYAVNGESFVQGIKLCFRHLAETHSSNYLPVSFDTFDDQNNSEQAHKMAKAIVKENRHVAVIGHHYSSCSISAGKIYKKYCIPAISPASTNINVTLDNDWYFRTIFNDYLQSKYLAIYVKEVLNKKRVSIIHEDLKYGAYLGQVFENECKKLGLSIAYKRTFEVNDPQQDKILENIIDQLATKNDIGILFLAMHSSEGIKLVKMIKDRHLPIPIITPDAFASQSFQKGFKSFSKEEEQPGFYTNGIYVITPIIFDTANEDGQKFRNSYIRNYEKEPGWHAAFAYDTAKVLYQAIARRIDPDNRSSIAKERKEIRDELASISNIDKSIKGITGYNFFDQNGDPPKPVSVGVYKHGKIISAMNQLQVVSKVPMGSNNSKKEDIKIDNQLLTKTRVVYTGIKVNELSDINMQSLFFSIDCFLWFRFRGELDTDNITFNNATIPVMLKNLSQKVSKDGTSYHLYHLKGRFKADAFPYKLPFGKHLLGLSFHHKSLDRNHLIYVVDMIGMGMMDQKLLLGQINTGNVLNPSYGWAADQVHFFQSITEESSLGVPEYLDINSGVITYSQFNLGIRIKRSKFGLNHLFEIFPGDFTTKLLIVSTMVIIFLAIIIRKRVLFHNYTNLIWFVQVCFSYLVLLTFEILILNSLIEKTSMENVRLIKRFFDILWWLIPAYCLNMAIKRFIWLPLENKTSRNIPTVAKRFVAFIIMLFSIFGIVAFVFDERITGLLATSGVFAMIIGLAVQMNISNIFSGIALNVERPFRTGDWVKIGDLPEGKVLDINWRSTRLRCRDNSIHNVPNSMVSDNEITNYSYPNLDYENHFFIHIDPSHAPDRVKKIIMDALLSVKEINNEPSPFVRFKGTTEFSTMYGVFYSSNQYQLKNQIDEIVWGRVFIHLKRAGIHIAMQRHRIYMTSDIPMEEDETSQSINLLKEIDLFKLFSEEDRNFISQRFRHHHYRAGQMLVRQGEAGDSLFIIVEGVVSISVILEDKKEIEVARLGAENIFGEMALLTGEPRSANVKSITDSHVLEINKQDIAPLIEAQPELSTLLGEVLTKRKQITQSILTNMEISEIENVDIPKRIVSKILNYFGVKV
ncbi:membrane protein containing Mechanosensitive ion channel MscS [Candidatus Magnetomorum sp. HK-1]|nr:membrane protein containing Mechanosensitive ion channel MscS [Candidatus Magnetomorum sp. HK-1]